MVHLSAKWPLSGVYLRVATLSTVRLPTPGDVLVVDTRVLPLGPDAQRLKRRGEIVTLVVTGVSDGGEYGAVVFARVEDDETGQGLLWNQISAGVQPE